MELEARWTHMWNKSPIKKYCEGKKLQNNLFLDRQWKKKKIDVEKCINIIWWLLNCLLIIVEPFGHDLRASEYLWEFQAHNLIHFESERPRNS